MKKTLLFIFIVFNISLNAQIDKDIIKELEQKISNSKSKERIKLLDSLATITWRQQGYNFDSITKVTIAYAIAQDTVDVAAPCG
ncbi:MAG: hypothetical protein COA67_09290 [Lutibacter sp.]|nr:MAG: hypothetical protein COA67_09290 [Lutibacter sp.]